MRNYYVNRLVFEQKETMSVIESFIKLCEGNKLFGWIVRVFGSLIS